MTTARNRRPRFMPAVIAATAITAAIYASTPARALTPNNWGGTNGSYNTAGNWNNGNVPISTDQANIFSGTVTLSANSPIAGGILVGKVINTPSLNTAGFKLTCSGTVQVDNTAVLFLGAANAGASLQTSTLTITNGSIVDMFSASAVLNATNAISIDGPSTFDIQGTANATNSFNENGTLNVLGTSTLNTGTFTLAGNSTYTAGIVLGGNSLTINAGSFSLGNLYTRIDLSAAGSHLSLNSTAFGAPLVNANITVGNSSHLSFPGSGEFLLGNIVSGITAGSVNLNGGSTVATAAVVDNYAFYESIVNVNGFASMPGSAEFDGGSVTTINANSTLTVSTPYFRGVPHNALFGGTDNYSNITFNGNGTLNWTGGATGIGYSGSNISTTVIVNTPTFNWEGSSGSNSTIDIQNGELDVYSTSLQNRLVFNGFFFTPVNGFDGNMTVEGGAKLNVANTAWTMYGSLTLGPGAVVQGQTLTFNGNSLPAGNYSLYPSFSGSTYSSIQAPTVFGSNAVVYMGFQGGIHLDGPTTWAGGTLISAPYVNSPFGFVVQNGNATVTANTTLFCNTYDMDGSANNATWNILANVTLTQQAWNIDPADTVNNPFHSTINLAGTLDMETQAGKWTLAGGTLNITGNGTNSAIVQHDKLVLGLGSAIGTINVASGGNGFIFGGLESAATGVPGGNIINLNGYLVMDSTLTFDANSVTTQTGDFAFEVNTAPVCGVGSVFNLNGGEAQFGSGIPGPANLIMTVQNFGLIALYDASNIKSLHIIGTGGAVISVGGHTVFINGDLTLDGGANPTGSFGITDNKVIVQATAGTKAGLLATYRSQVLYGYNHPPYSGIYDGYLPANYGLAVIDNGLLGRLTFGGISVNPNSILFSRELLGDANVDGVVNTADLNIVLSHFGAATGEWTSGNFDYGATIDLTDLADVLNNFGLTNPKAFDVAGGGGMEPAAVPEPTSLGLLLLAAPMLLSRRKRPQPLGLR